MRKYFYYKEETRPCSYLPPRASALNSNTGCTAQCTYRYLACISYIHISEMYGLNNTQRTYISNTHHRLLPLFALLIRL